MGWIQTEEGFCSGSVPSSMVIVPIKFGIMRNIENANMLNNLFDLKARGICLNKPKEIPKDFIKQMTKYHNEIWLKYDGKYEPLRNSNIEKMSFEKYISIDTIVSILNQIDYLNKSEYTIEGASRLFQQYDIKLLNDSLITVMKNIGTICNLHENDSIFDCCSRKIPMCLYDTLKLNDFYSLYNKRIGKGIYAKVDSSGYSLPYLVTNESACQKTYLIKTIHISNTNAITSTIKFLFSYNPLKRSCGSFGFEEKAIEIK